MDNKANPLYIHTPDAPSNPLALVDNLGEALDAAHGTLAVLVDLCELTNEDPALRNAALAARREVAFGKALLDEWHEVRHAERAQELNEGAGNVARIGGGERDD